MSSRICLKGAIYSMPKSCRMCLKLAEYVYKLKICLKVAEYE